MNVIRNNMSPRASRRGPMDAISAKHPRLPFGTRQPAFGSSFTLIELLVVISIIAVLAAFLVPVMGAIKRHELINRTRAEMSQLETAIESYHSAYGFYPPDNPKNPLINQLYYELIGTTNVAPQRSTVPKYQLLDNSSQALTGGSGGQVSQAFNVSGFMNCSNPGAGDEARHAQSFITDLKPDQIQSHFTNIDVPITFLVASVGGPDPNYDPIRHYEGDPKPVAPGVNPWRYLYPGTNNPNSYDLWVQLVLKPGQTDLICNWSRQVEINTSWP